MKMTQVVSKPREEVIDILCDSCGKSCKDPNSGNYEYLALMTNWGYGSKHDTESWSAQICEECAETKLIPIIKFQIENYMG